MCQLIKGLKLLPMFDIVMKEIKLLGEEFFDVCSRKGQIKAMNVSLHSSVLTSKVPNGDYRVMTHSFDTNDENIFNITIDVLIKH
jgi:hypothetical protein